MGDDCVVFKRGRDHSMRAIGRVKSFEKAREHAQKLQRKNPPNPMSLSGEGYYEFTTEKNYHAMKGRKSHIKLMDYGF